MTENEPTDERKASASGLPWPDPSRPIVNQRPPGYGDMPPTVGSAPRGLPESLGPRWRALVVVVLVVLVVVLVMVWLLWWR